MNLNRVLDLKQAACRAISRVMTTPWQPALESPRLKMRPLLEADFEPLFAAASDPLIWEQHPDRERHTRARFEIYFRTGLESGGALAILDPRQGDRIIGSSRFSGHNPQASAIEIGWTFIERSYWATGLNRELKTLMLDHAFKHVETVYFIVGANNHRSRRAMTKLGGELVEDHSQVPLVRDWVASVVFRMTRSRWDAVRPLTESGR
jgi:RimJ/RimL family protein N-acetyltransferase